MSKIMTSFYAEEELAELGLKKYGNNVLISRKCSIYSPEKISLGDNVRIDDFCILSGNITLGSYIHISAYCALFGSFGIEMENYTGLSPRCTIFSASDDFSGDCLIGPMVDKSKTNITGGKVLIKKYSQIGACSTILPAIIINEGVAVGAMSLVNKDLDEWGIYAGIPVQKIKERSKGLLKLVTNPH
jgi:galactoside O-acetyltransferase